MTASQQNPVYRKCNPETCGYCTFSKEPEKINCWYTASKESNNLEITFEVLEKEQICKHNRLQIPGFSQARRPEPTLDFQAARESEEKRERRQRYKRIAEQANHLL
jgi:hypothetical protein